MRKLAGVLGVVVVVLFPAHASGCTAQIVGLIDTLKSFERVAAQEVENARDWLKSRQKRTRQAEAIRASAKKAKRYTNDAKMVGILAGFTEGAVEDAKINERWAASMDRIAQNNLDVLRLVRGILQDACTVG